MTRPADPSPRGLLIGIILTVLAGVLLASMDAVGKHLSQAYLVIQVVWARYFFHSILVFGTLSARHGFGYLRPRRPVLQLVRAACLLGVTVFLYTALSRVPLADAIAVQFFAPVLVTILSMFFLKEQVGIHRISAVVIGFIGVLVIIRPSFSTDPYMFLPFVSAVLLATYLLLTRLLSTGENPHSTMFYTTAVGALCLTALMPFFWQTPDLYGFILMVLMGLCGAVGHVFVIKALAYAPASTLSPFLYSHVLFAAILSIAIFGDPLTALTLLGMALLVGSGLYIWWRERKKGFKTTT